MQISASSLVSTHGRPQLFWKGGGGGGGGRIGQGGRHLTAVNTSGGSRISGRGGSNNYFISGAGYWRGVPPPVTARGSGGAL